MLNELVLGLYVLLIGLCVAFFFAYTHLTRSLEAVVRGIDSKGMDLGDNMVEDMRDSMQNIVQDTLASLKQPEAHDHVAGALGQVIQMWAFKTFGDPAAMAQQAIAQATQEHQE